MLDDRLSADEARLVLAHEVLHDVFGTHHEDNHDAFFRAACTGWCGRTAGSNVPAPRPFDRAVPAPRPGRLSMEAAR
jgi:hypothetical protein